VCRYFLNAQLLAACREDEQRQIAGHTQPVGAAMIEETAWRRIQSGANQSPLGGSCDWDL
jgi:hypothetical protein